MKWIEAYRNDHFRVGAAATSWGAIVAAVKHDYSTLNGRRWPMWPYDVRYTTGLLLSGHREPRKRWFRRNDLSITEAVDRCVRYAETESAKRQIAEAEIRGARQAVRALAQLERELSA